MSSRSKAARINPRFGDHLLSRVQPKSGNLRQPLDRLLMLLHSCADHTVKLFHLLLDQLIALQIKIQQLLVVGLNLATKSLHQRLFAGTQTLIPQAG